MGYLREVIYLRAPAYNGLPKGCAVYGDGGPYLDVVSYDNPSGLGYLRISGSFLYVAEPVGTDDAVAVDYDPLAESYSLSYGYVRIYDAPVSDYGASSDIDAGIYDAAVSHLRSLFQHNERPDRDVLAQLYRGVNIGLRVYALLKTNHWLKERQGLGEREVRVLHRHEI